MIFINKISYEKITYFTCSGLLVEYVGDVGIMLSYYFYVLLFLVRL